MKTLSDYSKEFSRILPAILKDTYTRTELSSVISFSHALALALLRKKYSSGRINLTIIHLDLHDIAYDCIAELFRRDTDDSLMQFKAYFEGLPTDSMSDGELTDHLRRLVFSKVEQGIFRLYADHDVSLAKILRNIKLSIGSVRNFIELDRFGEIFIAPAAVDPQFHLPSMPLEAIRKLIHEIIDGNDRIPAIMAKLSVRLRQESEYAKAVPLISVAIAVRMVLSEELPSIEEQPATNLEIIDLRRSIETTVLSVKELYRPKYVQKKKMTNSEYDTIFTVVEKNLIAVIIDEDGQDYSLYKSLKRHIPRLTKAQYIKRYKAIVEYMLTTTKRELGKKIK